MLREVGIVGLFQLGAHECSHWYIVLTLICYLYMTKVPGTLSSEYTLLPVAFKDFCLDLRMLHGLTIVQVDLASLCDHVMNVPVKCSITYPVQQYVLLLHKVQCLLLILESTMHSRKKRSFGSTTCT